MPNVPLTSCIKEEKKNLLIVDPPSIEDTINNTTVQIETTENNVVDNEVMEVDNSNNATMEKETEVQRQTCIIKNSVVDTMLQCVKKLNNGEMEHGLIEAASEDITI